MLRFRRWLANACSSSMSDSGVSVRSLRAMFDPHQVAILGVADDQVGVLLP
jgi:hypothetical protein